MSGENKGGIYGWLYGIGLSNKDLAFLLDVLA